MATLKERVHRYNGTDYDVVYYETSSDLVVHGDSNVGTVLDNKMDDGRMFYASASSGTPYYITTSTKVGSGAAKYLWGMIHNTGGRAGNANVMYFSAYWDKTTFSNASYYDPLNEISEFSFNKDEEGNVYYTIKFTHRYIMGKIYSYDTDEHTNFVTAISTTAPATFDLTLVATKANHIHNPSEVYKNYYIPYPAQTEFRTTSSSGFTGYLKIETPLTLGSTTDVTFTVSTQRYSTLGNSQYTITLGCASSSTNVATLKAYSVGNYNQDLTVRADVDADNKIFVTIGESTTAWKYIHVNVMNVRSMIKEASEVNSGWTITVTADITFNSNAKSVTSPNTGGIRDATTSLNGLMTAADKTKLDGIATGATANTGTITGITMNGASKGTSGVVDLGTVITSHQDISGKAPNNHASSATTYGTGTNSNYGHVKLSDATNSTSSTSDGIAATPAAVKAAYDLANGKAASSHTHAPADLSSAVTVAKGGTGLTTLTSGSYLVGNGTSAVTLKTLASLKSDLGISNLDNLSAGAISVPANGTVNIFTSSHNIGIFVTMYTSSGASISTTGAYGTSVLLSSQGTGCVIFASKTTIVFQGTSGLTSIVGNGSLPIVAKGGTSGFTIYYIRA